MSAVRTVIALANMKQSQSYAFDILTTLFVSCACFYICFQSFFKVFKVSRTRLIFWQLYLYHVLVFTFVFKVFKQASHRLKDNSGISLNLQAVYPSKIFFFSKFQIICSRRKYNLHLLPFWWQNWKKWSVQVKALKV